MSVYSQLNLDFIAIMLGMNVAIVGASGFLGKNLSDRILADTDWYITAIARDLRKIKTHNLSSSRYRAEKGDITDYSAIASLLKNIDVVYYFVHMMGHKGINFYEAELKAAKTLKRAVDNSDVKRVIFVGGLGDDDPKQSQHLASRHRTGDILRESNTAVIEFRAAMIIGQGSVAFDIIKNIVERLPLMILPKSANTLTQPIALNDTLDYLIAAAELPIAGSQVVEIGGPEVLSYAKVYHQYAAYRNKRRLIIKVPLMPVWLSGQFLNLLTPSVHAKIGREMVGSMTSELVVRDQRAQQMFPDITPASIAGAFEMTR